MKKVLLGLTIFAVTTLSANAQKSDSKSDSQFKLDIGAAAALPTGDLSNVTSFGIGGFLKGAYSLSSDVDGTLTATYTSFTGKSIDGGKYPSQGIFSVLAGGSYLMDGGFHIDAGIGFGSYSVSGGGGSLSGFAYRGGIGYKLVDAGLDITANYNGLSVTGGSLAYIGLGISYAIVK